MNAGVSPTPVLRSPPLNTPRRERRIKRVIILLLVVGAAIDWTRPPQQQLSVPIYEWVVIRGYRATIRPATSLVTRCHFRPSCSQYSSEAVHKYGLPNGVWLTLKRLFRDMPWIVPGKPDPVP